MNTYTISLSSDSTEYKSTLPTVELLDQTRIELILTDIYSKVVPAYLKIDWGDGKVDTVDNDIYQNTSTNTIKENNVLVETYTHIYDPSAYALYKRFTVQVYIMYRNLKYCLITIPFSLRSYDFFESIVDLNLINTNILPTENNDKEYQLLTTKNNSIVELRT